MDRAPRRFRLGHLRRRPGAAVAIGLNWKRATPLAATVAVAANLIANFGIEVFDLQVPGGLHGGTVALSLVLFFGISFASKPPKIDPEIEALMDI